MQAQTEIVHFPYTVSHRDVKYPRLEFRTGTLLVILPKGQDEKRILKKHKHWIDRKYQFINDAIEESTNVTLSSCSLERLRILVHNLIEIFSQEIGCAPGRVCIKKMVTKWASCSKKGTITINSQMTKLPENLIEYIIFHEMAHLRYHKHDELFWKYVKEKFPNPEELEKDLCIYWFLVEKTQ